MARTGIGLPSQMQGQSDSKQKGLNSPNGSRGGFNFCLRKLVSTFVSLKYIHFLETKWVFCQLSNMGLSSSRTRVSSLWNVKINSSLLLGESPTEVSLCSVLSNYPCHRNRSLTVVCPPGKSKSAIINGSASSNMNSLWPMVLAGPVTWVLVTGYLKNMCTMGKFTGHIKMWDFSLSRMPVMHIILWLMLIQ